MFAFCPLLSQRTCGIANEDKPEVNISARSKEQIVYTKEMRYMQPSPNHTKEYDFCHYTIAKNESISEEELAKMKEKSVDGKVYIHVRF